MPDSCHMILRYYAAMMIYFDYVITDIIIYFRFHYWYDTPPLLYADAAATLLPLRH